MVARFIFLRHARPAVEWQSLSYERLKALIDQRYDPGVARDVLKDLTFSSLPFRPIKVVTSPLKRAFETARAIAEALNVPVEVNPTLKEVIFSLSLEDYLKGPSKIRELGFEAAEALEPPDFIENRTLYVTHGFRLHGYYLKLFGKKRRFDYLEGFDERGAVISLF